MGYNILVVDDSTSVRRMIVRMLGLGRLPIDTVFQAENGRQALECLAENRIALVLTDINMPEMDGTELVRKMERERLLQKIPVVVISTEGSDARVGDLRGRGIRGYLRKPFTPEALVKVVKGAIGENLP